MRSPASRIDQVLIGSLALIIAGIIAIVTASAFTRASLARSTDAIAEESRSMVAIDDMQSTLHALLLDARQRSGQGEAPSSQSPEAFAERLGALAGQTLVRISQREQDAWQSKVMLAHRLRMQVVALKRNLAEYLHTPRGPLDPGRRVMLETSLADHALAVQASLVELKRLHMSAIEQQARDSSAAKRRESMLLGLGLAAGCVLLLLGYMVHSRYVFNPIKQLADAAHRVGHGDLDIQLEGQAGAEIGTLHRIFNEMVSRRRVHEELLARFTRQLETEVAARTHDLLQANESLKTAQNKLVRLEKMALLGQIATSVNHEIRTPINALSMNVQLLRKMLAAASNGDGNGNGTAAPDPAERRTRQQDILRRIGQVEGEIDRISGMLEEFVHYARMAPPQLTPLALNSLVERLVDMLRERASQSGVEIAVDLEDPPPTVNADAGQLHQTLLNLCMNAIQAMPDGGRLSIAVRRAAGGVEIEVRDTGTGIAADDRDKIFAPFFTRKKDGLGFGLSIVQRIVTDHEGEIRCDSRLGEGTLFTILLPAHDRAAA